jgi:hypothetical protein
MQDTFCVTVLQTSHIRTNGGGWFFRGCRECNKKVDGAEPLFACIDGHKTDDPLIKYVFIFIEFYNSIVSLF